MSKDNINIPEGSIVGINYSGMHDSAVVVVGPDGNIVSAVALERYSRVKQDGRPPTLLLADLPWEKISRVAVSTNREFYFPDASDSQSVLLQARLPAPRRAGLLHRDGFYKFIDAIPCEKTYVCHQEAHAESALLLSGYKDALCLTYDGGMANSPWFGGLFRSCAENGLSVLDRFSSLHYAKITSVYTFVTAILGFSPNKHEGKITGLAALGAPSDECIGMINGWLGDRFFDIECTMEWLCAYDAIIPPALIANDGLLAAFRSEAAKFSPEELAASVQCIAEQHVIGILRRAESLGWKSDRLCLAGGLFSNVKINQRVAELGFSSVFVAPPMTDDGTALGAALSVARLRKEFKPVAVPNMYLGPSFKADQIVENLQSEGIVFEALTNPTVRVAQLLADGAVVAVFQGRMEFGPRALGNRSIIAQASKVGINTSLNERLNRTEFMPFAPVTRYEDRNECYVNIETVVDSARFMTVTVACTEFMKQACPAAVHVDGTARPQLVSADDNPFVHRLLTEYRKITGLPSLVNTSFNIHEEPIVCSPSDALQGFFESGIDYLYFEGGILIDYKNNLDVALRFVQRKLRTPSQKNQSLQAVVSQLSQRVAAQQTQLIEKERAIQFLKQAADELHSANKKIEDQSKTLRSYQLAYGSFSPFGLIARFIRRSYEIFRPRLGMLVQYAPRPLQPSKLTGRLKNNSFSKISIVTPSYQQCRYIGSTIDSVLTQNYPALEYYVQDGGSEDGTLEILRKCAGQLSGWESEKDAGQAHAINKAFAKTEGEIMAWINSDDCILPGVLHLINNYFESNPDIDVVYGNRLLIDEDGLEIGRWILPGHDSKVLSWADYIPQETMFWRRSIWEKIGGRLDVSFQFAMDWDLLLRFRDAGARFAHIPEFLGAFRIHGSQKTSNEIGHTGRREMAALRLRSLGFAPEPAKIRAAVTPFLIRHVASDLLHRLRTRLC